MRSILDKCGGRTGCLASPKELIGALPIKAAVDEQRLGEIIECLDYDGYIDVVLSDRHGEKVYCITLKARGKGFGREAVQSKRYLAFRIAIAVGSALITYAVGKILYMIIR